MKVKYNATLLIIKQVRVTKILNFTYFYYPYALAYWGGEKFNVYTSVFLYAEVCQFYYEDAKDQNPHYFMETRNITDHAQYPIEK